MLSFELLYRGALSLSPFLAVKRERHGHRLRAGLADDVERFANGGARGDYVIHHDHASPQRGADDIAAFAVSLRFLAIEGVGHVPAVLLRVGHRRRRDEGDALVGRPEQYIELDARLNECRRVTLPQRRRRLAVAEQSGVEEVGALASRFQLEAAEAEGLARQRELDEAKLVVLHDGRGFYAPVKVATMAMTQTGP